MQSLLESTQPDRYAVRRHLRRDEKAPVSHRHQYVLALHLAGKKVGEIEQITKYRPATIYAILSSPNVLALRQQLLHHTSKEFEALFPQVVDAIREALQSPDLKIALEGSDKWLKAHGKYAKSEGTQVQITAEDVVFNILNQNQTQINAAGRSDGKEEEERQTAVSRAVPRVQEAQRAN